jgi:1-aminocyclopropane-1-carboxylate deaminase/D-cysteine desulfhydrase-like pyridoxal-dependent ACC family enzyme
MSGPVLFEKHPGLSGRIPWMRLETSPSPVERLEHFGHEHLWVKRDDLISPVYGGNKVRKLEFALAEALSKGKSGVVTMGGIGSNHALATSIFCQRLEIPCTLLLYDQPVTLYALQNLKLYSRYGADIVYQKTILRTGLDFYVTGRVTRRNAAFIYSGGSSTAGTLGYVNAGFEIARQVGEGLMPEPDYLVCPLASNGTMAGLMLGLALAGMKTRVVGVLVAMTHFGPVPLNTKGTVTRFMRDALRLMREASPEVPDIALPEPVILEGYLGKGYGYPTDAGNAAIEAFREAGGIRLDPVYSGKAASGMLDFIEDPGHRDDIVLFLVTYNAVDMSAEAAAVDYWDLPPELHKFFEEG